MKGIQNTQTLDREWMELIYKAKQIGLTIEEVRNFLKEERKSKAT